MRPRRLAVVFGVAALALSTLAAAPRGGDDDADGQSKPQYRESILETYRVETEYGTIYGEVVRPVVPDGVRVPVILTYTPYAALYEALAGGSSIAEDATAEFFVPRGYARAVFDVVGTHNSGGCTDFGGLGERRTGAAVVDFLGTQEWANGRVGMIGASYDGTTAIAAAVENPQHLVTIVPQVAIDRWYDYMFNQGVRLTLEDSFAFGIDPPIDSPADYDFAYGFAPPVAATDDPAAWAAAVTDRYQPCNRVENQTRGYETDPVYDDFWIERDYRALADDVTASVLFEGAWLDDNVKHWAATRFFEALGADHERMLRIGQWTHNVSQFADAQKLRHAWFDHYLLELDTGVLDLPAVDSQANDGERRAAPDWPPPGTVEVTVPFGEDANDRGLVLAPVDGATSWTDDPTLTEDSMASGCGAACITLVTEPLDRAVRVAGGPVLELVLVTDAPSTHITPVLVDLGADGSWTPIARGLLNTRNRDGLAASTELVVGEPYAGRVELWDTDWILEEGHRLAVVLASSNAEWGLSDDEAPAASTSVGLSGSRLVLPVADGVDAFRAGAR